MKPTINISINIIIISLVILFFSIFFYYLFTGGNKIVQYRVEKIPIEHERIDYEKTKHKYDFKECNDMCNKDFCNEYQKQRIKYDLCKECRKENKCYDSSEGICVPCKKLMSCESLYGCEENKPPINPLNNYCTRCWKK